MHKLAIINSHVIQYFAPLYKRIAEEPDIDLTVYYCSRQGIELYRDPGFGVEFKWDIDLLDGYRSKFLPNIRKSNSVGGFFSLINPGIVRELAREKYDALWVHGHNYATYLIAIFTANCLGIPVLMRAETHLLLSRPGIKRGIRRPLMTFFYRHLVAATLPIGSRNKEFYRYHGVHDTRQFLVPYTVDNARFIESVSARQNCLSDLRRQYGLTTAMPVVLYASKLTARKNPMHLLKAFRKIREKGTRAQLVFVGSGGEESALKAYVKEHSISNVFFLGFRNQTELIDFLAIADVFVLPSVNEPWGLVINEAMCAGLPTIASEEIGAVPDLVRHGENGFVYQAGDIDSLSHWLDVLCTQPDLRRKMSKASLDRIHHWSYKEDVQGLRAALVSLRGAN